MPANLSPEYKSAELAFKQAREPKERLECLREMLRTIPKHKGTERLQADIKTRIKHLTEELSAAKKGGARGGPLQVIRPDGAAQIALLGPPNSGKSTLHARLTNSHAQSGPYPFTTHEPQPGMLPYEDIHFQLIDLPPLSAEHPVPWIANALQPSDACMLVVDLQAPDCIEQVLAIEGMLAEKRITLLERWERANGAKESMNAAGDADEEVPDPFALRLPTLLIATKADANPDRREDLVTFRELLARTYPAFSVSAHTGEGLDPIGPWLFQHLGVVRVYTKAPGRPPDKDRPFTVRHGDTVHDVARLVHKDLADSLKFARIWGSSQFSGQQVSRDHPVRDGDILELHA